MASITADQLKESLIKASNQRVTDVNQNQVQPIGEIRNSLRDFSFDFDAAKINAMDAATFDKFAMAIQGAPSNMARYSSYNGARHLANDRAGLIQGLSGNNPLTSLGKNVKQSNMGIGADAIASLDFSALDKDFADAVRYADALNQFGVSSKTAAQQFEKYGTFDPSAQVVAEKARAGIVPEAAPITTASTASDSFSPTDFSSTNKLADGQKSVMAADAIGKADDAFIQSAFEAFHGRAANPQELAAYRNKPIGTVRNEIIGGAQAAGLPTVAPGTVNVPTGILTPAQATAQGLQKVLRPDQLSAFGADQIVRDNQGGIYLKTETTTQAQREAVASGASGGSIGGVDRPVVESNLDASNLNDANGNPDPKSFITDGLTGGTSPSQVYSDFTNQVMGPFQAYLDSLDSKITASSAAIDAARANVNTLAGRITALTGGTANQDALAKAKLDEGLQAKRDLLATTMSQIANEKAKLQLGLIQEGNKLAPMSIITGRQNTLNQQAMARIGALTSIAALQSDDVDFAKDMVNASVTAINADRADNVKSLELLLQLSKDDIVTLSAEEKDLLGNRTDILKEAMDNAQKNADSVFKLISENVQAALSGKVSLSDSPALALSKMAPYMTDKNLDTTIREVGGRVLLLNNQTGDTIKDLGSATSGSGTPKDKYIDITRSDGSRVRVYTDANGRPTGEEVAIVGADASVTEANEEKIRIQARKDAADLILKLGEKEISWATAFNTLKAKYPGASNESIDSALNKEKYGKVK